MAYQNVGTCRFYIDQLQYLKSQISLEDLYSEINPDFPTQSQIGGGWSWYEDDNYKFLAPKYPELFTLDPINRTKLRIPFQSPVDNYNCILPTGFFGKQDLSGDNVGRYVALLNHNIDKHTMIPQWYNHGAPSGSGMTTIDINPILNMSESNKVYQLGNTIYEFDKNAGGFNPTDEDFKHIWISIDNQFQSPTPPDVELGALSYGVYYDMPNSADLDLTMTIDFDGTKSTQTLGGSTLTNTTYSGTPWWYEAEGYNVEPWACYYGDTTFTPQKRNGRRVWDLSFSYMSDENLFASNYMVND